jgi:hypothetical protein
VVGKPEETLTNIGRVCEWAVFQSGSLNAPGARIGECRVQANHKEWRSETEEKHKRLERIVNAA